MTTKHTPGPWTAKRAADGSGDFGILADGYVVGEVYAAIEHADERNPATPANAALIAAAPDLLAALRDLIGSVERGDPIGPAKRAALIAIAKAEGRS